MSHLVKFISEVLEILDRDDKLGPTLNYDENVNQKLYLEVLKKFGKKREESLCSTKYINSQLRFVLRQE
jgi:hypothetical protein